jgi:glycosyltransferase involved in cell wall biosynthesis
VALAASPEQRREWRERGLARAARFSWRRTARATRDLYEEVLAGARG